MRDVPAAQHAIHGRPIAIAIVDLDEDVSRGVTLEIEPRERRRLEALRVEREEVDLRRVELVQKRRQRAGCDIDLVPKQAKQRKVRYALSNSFGFGGTNACLIVGAV